MNKASAVRSVPSLAWKHKIIGVVRDIKPGSTFTSDEVRVFANRCGIADPEQPNGWGSVMSAAKRILLVRKTGCYRSTARKAGHRRIIAEWIRL